MTVTYTTASRKRKKKEVTSPQHTYATTYTRQMPARGVTRR
jgi:hypothetical protein